jgi:DNA polymerase-3 subunit gamma/tau
VALYQRARPQAWEALIGQDHVRDVLLAAISAGRLAHAYLFSGPRGVGKTSAARLIAMTVNCQAEHPPCGECASCKMIRAGNHPDVLEIDAASNNSVEDVRDLRERAPLSSFQGGYKVFILDEVHMLSRGAFNALLKILEEPPPAVIFILATTEPEKVPATVISRCQTFRFRRLAEAEIAAKLAELCSQEGFKVTPAALELIAKLADGAMRDAETLLERLGPATRELSLEQVERELGLPPAERLGELADALLEQDIGASLSVAGQLYDQGYATRTLLGQLKEVLLARLRSWLGTRGPADLQTLLGLLADLDDQDLRLSRQQDRTALELSITHLLRPAYPSGELWERVDRLEAELAALRGAPPGQGRSVPPGPWRRAEGPGGADRSPETPPGDSAPAGWEDFLRVASVQQRAFLKPARPEILPGLLRLSYPAASAFHAKSVRSRTEEYTELARRVFGDVTLQVNLEGEASPSPSRPALPGPGPAQATPGPSGGGGTPAGPAGSPAAAPDKPAAQPELPEPRTSPLPREARGEEARGILEHPLYGHLSQLFPHQVRELGRRGAGQAPQAESSADEEPAEGSGGVV